MKSPTDNIIMRIRTIAKEYDGRWMIVSAIALAMLLFGTRAHAQIVSKIGRASCRERV